MTLDDLRGDLHCHTVASDGHATIEEMALAAKALGHEYLAITDHSASHGFGNDVSPEALVRHVAAIREVDARLKGIRLLAGSEVNILPDGSLDYDDDVLAQLDWIVASVHTSFRMSAEKMTARIVRAIEHPLVDVIGHPTGRLIGKRAGYAVDMGAVIAAAARTGTFLEINGQPDRRDLDDAARARGGGRGREARAGLRRASRGDARASALGGRDGAAGVADAGRRREHADVEAAGRAAGRGRRRAT